MGKRFDHKPIKKLRTGWDWIKALHDFAYPDSLKKGIENWIKEITFLSDSQLKQRYSPHFIPIWEEWVRQARKDIERVYGNPMDCSLEKLLSHPPHIKELPFGSNTHKFLLLNSIVLDPPEFLNILALNDKKLSKLLKLQNAQLLTASQSKNGSSSKPITPKELSTLSNCFNSGTKNRQVLDKYISSYSECLRYQDLQDEIWGKPARNRPNQNAEKASSVVSKAITPLGFVLSEHKINGKTVGRKMIRLVTSP